LGFRNGTQYVSMGSIQGFDAFIASNYPNGFPGWLEEMSRKNADLIIVKMSDVSGFSDRNRSLFVDWLNANFSQYPAVQNFQSEKFRGDDIQAWVKVNKKSQG
jgi:hypothetical protein